MPKNRIPLLLIPGLLCDAELWTAQTAALDDVCIPQVANITDHDNMPDLATAILEHAPPEFALAGLSMGGYVALEIMRQAPQCVMRLALLDTQARPDGDEAKENRRRLIDMAEHGQFERIPGTLTPKLLHPDHAADSALVNRINAMGIRIGKDAFIRQERAIIGRIDSRPSLAAIDCPTLVLCGREDFMGLEVHQEMAASIRGARLEIIDCCGHLSAIEQPIAVNNALRAWLS